MNNRFARLSRSLVACVGLLAVVASAAVASVPEKNFGKQWAWDNAFNGSKIGCSFGTGSTPSLSVNYNFSSYSLYGYPACCRGYHYGYNPTGDTLFPKQLSKTSTIPCTFNYSSGGSNMAGDFAYDMFLRWDSSKSSPQLEVMVWAGNDSWPIGKETAANAVYDNGVHYDLWEGQNQNAGYYVFTFIPHGTAGQGSLPKSGYSNVDMKYFFNYLAKYRSSHYNNYMYLDVIEAGLEITRGNGWAWMGANFNAS